MQGVGWRVKHPPGCSDNWSGKGRRSGRPPGLTRKCMTEPRSQALDLSLGLSGCALHCLPENRASQQLPRWGPQKRQERSLARERQGTGPMFWEEGSASKGLQIQGHHMQLQNNNNNDDNHRTTAEQMYIFTGRPPRRQR